MINNEREFNKRLLLIFAILLFLIALNSIKTVLNADEIEHIHSAWKVLNTGAVFRDFFQHHHPLLYYIGAPIIALFGENIATLFILRGLALAILLGTILVTYLISIRLFDKKTALLSIVLLAAMRIFFHRAMEVRPDTPQVLFGLISILFLFSFYEKRARRDLIISSIALAISFLFLQKAILLIFLLGVIMVADLFRKDFTIKDLALYSLVFVLSLAPYYAYLLLSGSFDNYLLYGWGSNLGGLKNPFSPIHNIVQSIRRNTLVWAFYIPGIWLVFKTANRNANRVRLVILATGLFLSVFLFDHPNPQYFMHSAPLIIVLSSFALTNLFRANPRRLLILVIIGTVIPAYAIAKRPFKDPNTEQLKMIRYALSITEPEERVYDPGRYFNLFREDIDFFWYHARYVVFEGLCERINKDRPVLVTDKMLDPECIYIKRDYRRSKKFDKLYIRLKEK